MTKAEKLFHQIANELADGRESKIFGALCIKAKNGKSSAIFWKDAMIFKLNAEDEKEALSIPGASEGTHLYAPDRPMKGWVLIPFKHSTEWKKFAKKSAKNVTETKVERGKKSL